MPAITILKRKHSLVGKKLIPLIRKMSQTPSGTMARIKSALPIDEMSASELSHAVKEITGETEKELLTMAGKEFTVENTQFLLHWAIVLANEFGQPGQMLVAAQPGASSSASGSLHTPDGSDIEEDEQQPGKKRRKKELIERIDKLEKEREDGIAEIKEKVRALSMQTKPNEAMILITLEELARKARKLKDAEADIFEELSRQAHKNEGRISISTFALSVVGGKSSDIVLKAMSKCLKEKKVDQEISVDKKVEVSTSPLANLYPPQPQVQNGYAQWPSYPMWAGNGAFPHFSGSGQNMYRYRQSAPRSQWRPRGVCFFCDSPGHVFKDCEKMKQAKNK